MLIYTGISRDSSKEIKKINKTLDDKNSSQIQDLTDETPGDFIESEYSQNNELSHNTLNFLGI